MIIECRQNLTWNQKLDVKGLVSLLNEFKSQRDHQFLSLCRGIVNSVLAMKVTITNGSNTTVTVRNVGNLQVKNGSPLHEALKQVDASCGRIKQKGKMHSEVGDDNKDAEKYWGAYSKKECSVGKDLFFGLFVATSASHSTRFVS